MKKVLEPYPALLHSFTEQELDELLERGILQIKSYDKGNIIHLEGEPCTKFELILEGTVVIERIDAAGNLLTISEMKKGEILGGNLLFSETPYYPMTITSRSSARLLGIEKEGLFSLFFSHPSFLRSYLELTSANANILGDTLRYHIHTSLRERIRHFLEEERRRQHSSQIVLPMTKKKLAEKLGVQRTSLSRELSKMKQDGLIDFDRRTITLL